MALRLSELDDSNRADHYYVEETDSCYYMYEYTSGQNYAFSTTNGLISNLKKPMSTRNTPQWKFKGRAINQCAADLTQALSRDWLKSGTIVPVPPSKSRSHPDYDDRMLQVCRKINPGFSVDVRELVEQKSDLAPFHGGSRLSPDQLLQHYQIVQQVVGRPPASILIVDDVLTAGSHFKAMKKVLQLSFPEASIAGAFIARRVFANPFDAVDL